MDTGLSTRDRAIINAYQGGFPVVADPFDAAAEALRERGAEAGFDEIADIDADELLDRIAQLDDDGTLSRFGPLVNADEIGGTATLVAIHAPEDRYDEVVEAINDFDEVAHNYAREHPHLNVWFVVSVADADRVDDVLAEIEAETGQEPYNLPKLQEFRVSAHFPVEGPLEGDGIDLTDVGAGAEFDADSAAAAGEADASEDDGLSVAELDLVAAVQDGLPLTRTPYADVAAELGQPAEWVRETLARFEATGKIRRIGVVPNHYALGYSENGMTVWDVPSEDVTAVGETVAALPYVTHCYERPRHEGVWPYNLFAMTHGRSEAESEARIEAVRETIADLTEVRQWDTLFSTEILKKTGINVAERAAADADGDEESAQTARSE
ncbi:AsnC family transcriptional regulator [Salinarchaeum sp. Harcht-Bsk1]|uniref:siroheme decarboxylase subunit beta n=1 Tax=Salinarchaeum sp. Harcht-Bsk1 TaxID=1333523 RepID=UPI0003423AF1|nr:Lrp/AsnC family transcriptional regulator [Salinarchaeum sp. Harcht-Bsk1]AGN01887.1 AsnC family transcriptional regulator [Salinarchaeum sp. Harcht-Bsk1]